MVVPLSPAVSWYLFEPPKSRSYKPAYEAEFSLLTQTSSSIEGLEFRRQHQRYRYPDPKVNPYLQLLLGDPKRCNWITSGHTLQLGEVPR